MKATLVVPVDPAEGRQFNVLNGTPRSALTHELGLLQAVDGFGESVVVAVALGSHRGNCTLVVEPLGVTN